MNTMTELNGKIPDRIKKALTKYQQMIFKEDAPELKSFLSKSFFKWVSLVNGFRFFFVKNWVGIFLDPVVE